MIEPGEVVVRIGLDERQADDWSLALASAGTAHRIERASIGFEVVVGTADVAGALRLLDEYDRDNPRPLVEPTPAGSARAGAAASTLGEALVGPLVGTLLLAAYAWLARAAAGSAWFAAGSARAEAIVGGEWRRATTALLLHASVAHVVANAIAAALFLGVLARIVGPGAACLLALAAGAGGNLINGFVHRAHHDSVGASAAVFGAVGVLGGLQFARRRARAPGRSRAWVALGASLGLFAMLGTGGAETDVLAHLFGLLVGVALGITLAPPLAARRRPWLDALLGALAAAWLAGSWWLALRR